MKLRSKLLLLAFVPTVISLVVFVLIEYHQIKSDGRQLLSEKNQAILARMHAARRFIAKTGALDDYVTQVKETYPDGNIPDEIKKKLMNFTPISASWSIAKMKGKHEDYEFKIAALEPRNEKNKANEIEYKFLKELERKTDTLITYEDKASNTLWGIRPVYLKESEGCLQCHGNPTNSPWGNGKDILGYKMENWKDGDLRALFIIKSSLAPVDKRIQRSISDTLIWVALFLVIALVAGYFLSKNIFKRLGGEPEEVAHMVHEVAAGNLNLSFDRSEKTGIYKDIYEMHQRLRGVIAEVIAGADSLKGASSHINQSAQSMAEGSNVQAATADKVSQETKNMLDFVEKSTENAKGTSEKAQEISDGIMLTSDIAHESMTAVEEITSKIQVISEIAYKTRILALNATIEAARAGDAGKGFAAIAEEVQRLAALTRNAAIEIIDLSKKTFELSEQAKLSMEELSPEVSKVTKLIETISTTSEKQQTGAEDINGAIMELNAIAQQNASTSEELASSSEELTAQAEMFQHLISYFQVELDVKPRDIFEETKPDRQVDEQADKPDYTEYTNDKQVNATEEQKNEKSSRTFLPPKLDLSSDDNEFKSF